MLDPDNEATLIATNTLLDAMKAAGFHSIGKKEAETITLSVLCKFIITRGYAWAQRREPPPFGMPDHYDIGFIMSKLGRVKESAKAQNLPLEKPIKEWNKEQISTFLAIGAWFAQEAREEALEPEPLKVVGA